MDGLMDRKVVTVFVKVDDLCPMTDTTDDLLMI
jgi:hypothetical protein